MKRTLAALVVDDDRATLELLSAQLSSMGYEVHAAESPRYALELADDPAIELDLMITDIYMPEMNGVELARRVSSIYPGIKLIYISGIPDGQKVVRESGRPAPFLLKPFTADELGDVVRPDLRSKGRPYCPRCNSWDVRPSQFRFIDWVLMPVMAPHRCRDCRTRFSRVHLLGKILW